jgi:hypothetical protein
MEAKMTKDKRKRTKAAAQEPLINAFAAQHGTYREATVVDLSGELGGGRQKMIKVLRNLYPNVADRWLAEGGAGFEEPQRHAIEHCRALWASIGGQGKLVSSWSQTGGGGKHCRAQAQKAAMFKLVDQLRAKHPKARVCGHRDFPGVRKACPSFDVAAWLRETGAAGDIRRG